MSTVFVEGFLPTHAIVLEDESGAIKMVLIVRCREDGTLITHADFKKKAPARWRRVVGDTAAEHIGKRAPPPRTWSFRLMAIA